MEMQSVIAQLEQEWEQPGGFLGNLRMGIFDPAGFERLAKILESVEIGDTGTIDRRFVSLTWYIPIFMGWQRERLQEKGGDVRELEIATNRILGELERILGVP